MLIRAKIWFSLLAKQSSSVPSHFSFNSTVKQTVQQAVIFKNIHTTFNVLCFTPALSKTHNDCSYPIISLWLSTNQSRLYSFSCRHGNWLYCSVTVWNLAVETHKSAFSSELEMDRVLKQLQHQELSPSQFTPCVWVRTCTCTEGILNKKIRQKDGAETTLPLPYRRDLNMRLSKEWTKVWEESYSRTNRRDGACFPLLQENMFWFSNE